MARSTTSSEELPHRLLLYLDFLGVKEAATTWAPAQTARLLGLLQAISALQGEGDMSQNLMPDGTWRLDLRPDVDTFSDHIAASFELSSPSRDAQDPAYLGPLIANLRDMAGRIASHALKINLLVRGALTIGPLHHKKGVVFGSAMVEAHAMESTIAKYPRILVAQNVHSRAVDNDALYVRDDDGYYHLDYLRELFEAPKVTELVMGCDKTIKTIDDLIGALKREENVAAAEKWAWFREYYFKAAMAGRAS